MPSTVNRKRLSMTFLEYPRSKYNQAKLQKSIRTRAERNEDISDHRSTCSKSSKSQPSSRCMRSKFSTGGRTYAGRRAIPRRKHSRQENYLNRYTDIKSSTLHSSRSTIKDSKHDLTKHASNSKHALRGTGPIEGY